MWQTLSDELSDATDGGFEIVGVAVDDSWDDIEPWLADVRFRVGLDSQRLVSELYNIVNVPTVVWIDADGTIVRPNMQAFGDDTFRDFHGIDSSIHHDELRRWVLDDEPPIDPGEIATHRMPPTWEEQLGRTTFRLATHLLEMGEEAAGRAELERAMEISPDDFTVWRAALPLLGDDPFGETFFSRYAAWQDRTGGQSYRSR